MPIRSFELVFSHISSEMLSLPASHLIFDGRQGQENCSVLLGRFPTWGHFGQLGGALAASKQVDQHMATPAGGLAVSFPAHMQSWHRGQLQAEADAPVLPITEGHLLARLPGSV